jgi:hypothetical protein
MVSRQEDAYFRGKSLVDKRHGDWERGEGGRDVLDRLDGV